MSEVGGRRSEVRGRRSEDRGRMSEVGGRRTGVGGRRSEVGGRRSVTKNKKFSLRLGVFARDMFLVPVIPLGRMRRWGYFAMASNSFRMSSASQCLIKV
jgi:hypothetical protein